MRAKIYCWQAASRKTPMAHRWGWEQGVRVSLARAPSEIAEWVVSPSPVGFGVLLTIFPVSAMLSPMTSLIKTGSGMFAARAGRGRPGCDEKRLFINRSMS
jgi:hypothetical protein